MPDAPSAAVAALLAHLHGPENIRCPNCESHYFRTVDRFDAKLLHRECKMCGHRYYDAESAAAFADADREEAEDIVALLAPLLLAEAVAGLPQNHAALFNADGTLVERIEAEWCSLGGAQVHRPFLLNALLSALTRPRGATT